jgi:ABC-type sugar transport system permease subunit
MLDVKKHSAALLSLPFAFVIFTFFVVPLCLVVMVSFWDYNSYSIIPDFIFTNYQDIFLLLCEKPDGFMHIFCNLYFKLEVCFHHLVDYSVDRISGRAVFVFLCV